MRIGERLERGLEARKDIQWQLRENEARYRDLLDNQADVILRRDARARLTFLNRAFCGVLGVAREDVPGRPFVHRVLHSPRRAGASPALRAGDRHRGATALL